MTNFERAPGFFGVAGSAASWLSSALCLLGHPAAALSEAVEAVADAREQGEAFSLAMALFHQALIDSLLRDYRTTLQRADELLALANSHELSVHQAQATFFRSWALAVSAQSEDSIMDIIWTISIAQASASTWGLARLAEAYGRYGRLEEGLATVANGLALAERTGERIGEAELHRFQGELLLMRDPSSEAEAERCFRTAIDVARRQKAKWWELRATTSLARLLRRQQGRIDEARGMLGGIYNWFTEGLDTADLKDAKALLDELVG